MSMMLAPGSYPHRRAGHCGSGSLRDLLEFHGLSYERGAMSEGAAFGLAGGLGFFYASLPGVQPPLYLVGRTADLERDFCAHLGIDLDLFQTDDPRLGWEVLRAELDAGRPTMVWADIAHLEYLRVRMSNTMHDIVVCGYDEHEGVALVADNDRDELQRCSLESLARARSSEAFPGPNRHATWRMRWPADLPPVEETVRRALVRAVENMESEGSPLSTAEGAGGVRGVRLLLEDYPAWPERFGEGLEPALRALRVFIVKAGTAGAMFRSLHAEFLTDAARWLDDRRLDELAALYGALSEQWVELARSVSDRELDPLVRHQTAGRLIEPIAALEIDGVAAMRAWLDR